jgi:hypothetical protein
LEIIPIAIVTSGQAGVFHSFGQIIAKSALLSRFNCTPLPPRFRLASWGSVAIQTAFVFWHAIAAPKAKMPANRFKNDALMVERQRY